jgi:hypothetical protein
MSDDQIYALVPSNTTGRYALDDAQYGADITSRQPLDCISLICLLRLMSITL